MDWHGEGMTNHAIEERLAGVGTGRHNVPWVAARVVGYVGGVRAVDDCAHTAHCHASCFVPDFGTFAELAALSIWAT